MATIEREFYRSARGPAPTDEDTWRLVEQNTEKFWSKRLRLCGELELILVRNS
jgi:hypothetical protein